MRRVLAIQHTFSEFLGALEPQLEARGIGFSYVRPAVGEDVPVPEALGELIESSRALWGDMEETTARVAAALVEAVGLMDERRKMPVFPLAQGR